MRSVIALHRPKHWIQLVHYIGLVVEEELTNTKFSGTDFTHTHTPTHASVSSTHTLNKSFDYLLDNHTYTWTHINHVFAAREAPTKFHVETRSL